MERIKLAGVIPSLTNAAWSADCPTFPSSAGSYHGDVDGVFPRVTHPARLTLLAASLAGCAPATMRSPPGAFLADSTIHAALSAEGSLNPASFPERSVGVLPFRIASADTTLAPLGYGLAELLMTDLARSPQVDVVDRLRTAALLRELQLAGTGLTDAAEGPRAGRILGARHLVLGQLSTLPSEGVRVDARLARSETGVVSPIVAGVTALDDILEAEQTLAFRTFEAMGVTLTPAERASIERRPTRNLAALMAFSRGVRAEFELRFHDARQEYQEAVRLDRAFGEPRSRLQSLRAWMPDPLVVGSLSMDAINRPHLPPQSDVVDPAFQDRPRATLIIPVIVR